MTDRDVDVIFSVACVGDGEQRGDWPALDDLELIVDHAPLDVLRMAEVRFDPPAQQCEPQYLGLRQRWSLLSLGLDRLRVCAAGRGGHYGELLGTYRCGDD